MDNKASELLQKPLRDLGLTEKETRLYLAAHALGATRIAALAAHAKLRRSTTYTIIESLKEKGLLVEHVRGFKKLYSATAPEMLEVLHTNKLNALRETFPLFEQLKQQRGVGGTVTFLEGIEAVKSMYEELLTSATARDYYYVLNDVEKWRNDDPAYFDSFISRRKKLGLNLRLLFTHSSEAQNRKKLASKLNERVKFLPPGITIDANLAITPKRLLIHQTTSPIIALSVETPSFIELHRVMFELLWDGIAE